MKKILAVLLSLIMLSVSFTSCVDKNNDNTGETPAFDGNAIVGKWELYSLIFQGETLNLGDEYYESIVSPSLITMEFKADGTGFYTLSVTYGGEFHVEESEVAWEVADDCWNLEINDIPIIGTLVDGKLILDDTINGDVIILTKVA